MATLFLRNVPDDPAERLRRLATQDRMSVDVVAMRELSNSSRRVDAAALLATLPDLDIDTATILDDALLDVGRRLQVDRHAPAPQLERRWLLEHTVSASDAGYVALADSLGCALVTADARLAGAAGIGGHVTLAPRCAPARGYAG